LVATPAEVATLAGALERRWFDQSDALPPGVKQNDLPKMVGAVAPGRKKKKNNNNNNNILIIYNNNNSNNNNINSNNNNSNNHHHHHCCCCS